MVGGGGGNGITTTVDPNHDLQVSMDEDDMMDEDDSFEEDQRHLGMRSPNHNTMMSQSPVVSLQ